MIRHKFCWRLRNHELISFRPSSSVPLKHCLITLLTLVNPLDLEDLCRCPGVIAFRRRLFRSTSTATIHFLVQPVQKLLNHNWKTLIAAYDDNDNFRFDITVHYRFLADHQFPKSNRSKRHKTKTYCIKVEPVLYRVIHGGGAAGHDNQYHPVHWRLPRVKVVVLWHLRGPPVSEVTWPVPTGFPPELPFMGSREGVRQEGDYFSRNWF